MSAGARKNPQVAVRLTRNQAARLKRAARAKDVSPTELVRRILDDVLPAGTDRAAYDVPLPGFPEPEQVDQ